MLQEGKAQEDSQQKALICPFLATRPATLDDSFKRMVGTTVPNACLGEDCAWWNADRMECSVLSLARISTAQEHSQAHRQSTGARLDAMVNEFPGL